MVTESADGGPAFGGTARSRARLIAVLCASCSGSQQMMLGQPTHEQVAIVMTISDDMDKVDTGGGVATLAEAVSAGLTMPVAQLQLEQWRWRVYELAMPTRFAGSYYDALAFAHLIAIVLSNDGE